MTSFLQANLRKRLLAAATGVYPFEKTAVACPGISPEESIPMIFANLIFFECALARQGDHHGVTLLPLVLHLSILPSSWVLTLHRVVGSSRGLTPVLPKPPKHFTLGLVAALGGAGELALFSPFSGQVHSRFQGSWLGCVGLPYELIGLIAFGGGSNKFEVYELQGCFHSYDELPKTFPAEVLLGARKNPKKFLKLPRSSYGHPTQKLIRTYPLPTNSRSYVSACYAIHTNEVALSFSAEDCILLLALDRGTIRRLNIVSPGEITTMLSCDLEWNSASAKENMSSTMVNSNPYRSLIGSPKNVRNPRQEKPEEKRFYGPTTYYLVVVSDVYPYGNVKIFKFDALTPIRTCIPVSCRGVPARCLCSVPSIKGRPSGTGALVCGCHEELHHVGRGGAVPFFPYGTDAQIAGESIKTVVVEWNASYGTEYRKIEASGVESKTVRVWDGPEQRTLRIIFNALPNTPVTKICRLGPLLMCVSPKGIFCFSLPNLQEEPESPRTNYVCENNF